MDIFATVAIPLGIKVTVDSNATLDERQEAVFQAAITLYPELKDDIRKRGVIVDSSDESLVE